MLMIISIPLTAMLVVTRMVDQIPGALPLVDDSEVSAVAGVVGATVVVDDGAGVSDGNETGVGAAVAVDDWAGVGAAVVNVGTSGSRFPPGVVSCGALFSRARCRIGDRSLMVVGARVDDSMLQYSSTLSKLSPGLSA